MPWTLEEERKLISFVTNSLTKRIRWLQITPCFPDKSRYQLQRKWHDIKKAQQFPNSTFTVQNDSNTSLSGDKVKQVLQLHQKQNYRPRKKWTREEIQSLMKLRSEKQNWTNVLTEMEKQFNSPFNYTQCLYILKSKGYLK